MGRRKKEADNMMSTTTTSALLDKSHLNRQDVELHGHLRFPTIGWVDQAWDQPEKEPLWGDICPRCFVSRSLNGECSC